MRLTKNDMARVIVQARHALPALPAADHSEVVLRAWRGDVVTLTRQHKLACNVLSGAVEMKLPAAEVPSGLGWEILTGNERINVWVRTDGLPVPPRAVVRIEMNRGNGWEVRQSGELDQNRLAIVATIMATLPAYCVQYPHQALVDDVIVARAEPVL